MGRPIAVILEKLGAEEDGAEGYALGGEAFGVESVFGGEVGGCKITLFSEQAFAFAEPPEMAALGVLWVANVERPEDVRSAVRDAHGRLKQRLREHEEALTEAGFEVRLEEPEPEVRGRGRVGGFDVQVALTAGGGLEVREVSGRPVPKKSRIALEDALEGEADVKEAAAAVVRKMEEAGLLTGRGVFDAPTVRAPANEEPLSARSEAPDEGAPGAEEGSGLKRKPPRPRRRSRRSAEGSALSTEAAVGDSAAGAPDSEEAPAVDVSQGGESLLPSPAASLGEGEPAEADDVGEEAAPPAGETDPAAREAEDAEEAAAVDQPDQPDVTAPPPPSGEEEPPSEAAGADASDDDDAGDAADDDDAADASDDDDDGFDWEASAETRQLGPEDLKGLATAQASAPSMSRAPADESSESELDLADEPDVDPAEATALNPSPDVTAQAPPPSAAASSESSSSSASGERPVPEEEADSGATSVSVPKPEAGSSQGFDAGDETGLVSQVDSSAFSEMSMEPSMIEEGSEEELAAALADLSSEEEASAEAGPDPGPAAPSAELEELDSGEFASLPSGAAEPSSAEQPVKKPKTSDESAAEAPSTGDEPDPWASGLSGKGEPQEEVTPYRDPSEPPSASPPPEQPAPGAAPEDPATGSVSPLTSSAENTFQNLADVVGDGLRTGKTGAFVLDAEAFAFLNEEADNEIARLEAEEAELERRLAEVRSKLVVLRAGQAQAALQAEAMSGEGAVEEGEPKRNLAARMARLREERSEQGDPVAPGPAGEPAEALADNEGVEDIEFDEDNPETATFDTLGGPTAQRPEGPLPSAARRSEASASAQAPIADEKEGAGGEETGRMETFSKVAARAFAHGQSGDDAPAAGEKEAGGLSRGATGDQQLPEEFADGVSVSDLAAELGADATQLVEAEIPLSDLHQDDGGGVFDSPSESIKSSRGTPPQGAPLASSEAEGAPAPEDEVRLRVAESDEESEDGAGPAPELDDGGATRVGTSPLVGDSAEDDDEGGADEPGAAPEVVRRKIALVVQNARALERLERHLGGRYDSLVPIADMEEIVGHDELPVIRAMVFVRPRRDARTLDIFAELVSHPSRPKTLLLSSDQGFDEVEGIDLRLDLAQRAAEVAQQVVDGLSQLGVEAGEE